MSPRIEIHIDWEAGRTLLGHMRRKPSRGGEILSFAYAQDWLDHPFRFAIDPELPLTPGEYHRV